MPGEEDPRRARQGSVAVAEPRSRLGSARAHRRPGRWYPETEGGTSIPGARSGLGSGSPALVVSGRTPAQIGSAMSSSSSFGGPVRTLAEASSSGNREEERLAVFGGCGHPGFILPAGGDMRGDRGGGRVQFVLVGDLAGGPEDHDGPIVHRMVEGAPRHHEAVDDRGHDAHLGAGAERLPRSCGGGAVQVERVVRRERGSWGGSGERRRRR